MPGAMKRSFHARLKSRWRDGDGLDGTGSQLRNHLCGLWQPISGGRSGDMIFHHPPNTPPSFHFTPFAHLSTHREDKPPRTHCMKWSQQLPVWKEYMAGVQKGRSHMEVTAVWSRPQVSPPFSVALSGHHRRWRGWRGVCLSSRPFSCCLTGWTCGTASASGGHTKYRPGSQQGRATKRFKEEKYPHLWFEQVNFSFIRVEI